MTPPRTPGNHHLPETPPRTLGTILEVTRRTSRRPARAKKTPGLLNRGILKKTNRTVSRIIQANSPGNRRKLPGRVPFPAQPPPRRCGSSTARPLAGTTGSLTSYCRRGFGGGAPRLKHPGVGSSGRWSGSPSWKVPAPGFRETPRRVTGVTVAEHTDRRERNTVYLEPRERGGRVEALFLEPREAAEVASLEVTGNAKKHHLTKGSIKTLTRFDRRPEESSENCSYSVGVGGNRGSYRHGFRAGDGAPSWKTAWAT